MTTAFWSSPESFIGSLFSRSLACRPSLLARTELWPVPTCASRVVIGDTSAVPPCVRSAAGACSTPVNGSPVPISVPPDTVIALLAQLLGMVKLPSLSVVVVWLLQSVKTTFACDR